MTYAFVTLSKFIEGNVLNNRYSYELNFMNGK